MGGIAALAGPYLAEAGFSGAWWQQHWHSAYAAPLLTPPDYQGRQAGVAKRQHACWRQVVEAINGHLIRTFGLHFPGARTKRGLLTRLAAKLLAVNVGLWLSLLIFGRPPWAFATLLPC